MPKRMWAKVPENQRSAYVAIMSFPVTITLVGPRGGVTCAWCGCRRPSFTHRCRQQIDYKHEIITVDTAEET